MPFEICKKELCTGCSLCADVCPCNAIKTESDEYGFIRPTVDPALCIECGACAGSCPANSETSCDTLAVYAAYAKDGDIRRRSSSGGIFRLLADKTLEAGGAVAAVGYDDGFRAVYKTAERPEELDELMGSKYTEARSDGIYEKVKRLLDEGRKVLFVGTPCRVAALNDYVGNPDGLLTVDFICHGVPSAFLLERFLSERFDGGIMSISFRDKTHGWKEYSMRVDMKDHKPYIASYYKDPYLRVFFGNTALRESCYDCRFKGDRYAADITLCDFWGISSVAPSMNDDRGTSAVVIRTEKAFSAFDEIKELVTFKAVDPHVIANANPSLLKSTSKPEGREEMMKLLKDGAEFSAIAEKFAKPLPAGVIALKRIKGSVQKMIGKIKK